jgi:F-type H+-transporting ATPase subunit delta
MMNTQADALAYVYAHSLFELADQAGGTEKILEVAGELEQVCELARGDASFREFVASPIIDAAKRTASLRAIFENRITDLTLRFLLVLNHKQRLGHLEAINTALDQLVQERFGRVEVDVYTPAPLGDEQLQIVAQRIQAAIGKEPVIRSQTDESMIGGIKLRIGDQLIDGSVATRLRRMKQDILSRDLTDEAGALHRFLEDADADGGGA